VVSLASDADAISTVLSARVLNPDVRIVARANAESSEGKLQRAGVDHTVNPLSHGAHRMAAFAQQPAVADFLDVVVHDRSLEYQLEEVRVPAGSPLVGTTLGEAHLRARTGALVLALRMPDGTFQSNPGPSLVLAPDVTLIVIGTPEQFEALRHQVSGAGAL
jgi:voltage-gated potassium channel